jgi:hypothetical protein
MMNLSQEDRLQALVHAREIDRDDTVACIVAKMAADGSIFIFRAGNHAHVVTIASMCQFNEHAAVTGLRNFIQPAPIRPTVVENAEVKND